MTKIYMRYPQGKGKALTLSYDDGVEQDVRLIAILKKFGLKSTFNINSGMYSKQKVLESLQIIQSRMSKRQAKELYQENDMEVAVHGLSHLSLEVLPTNVCTYEILQDRLNLEAEYKKIIRGMAYPLGTYSDRVVECAKQCGIAYARTIISTESFELPSDWLRLKPTCHHKNSRLMELAREFVEKTIEGEAQLFFLWGHSYEFDADDNWELIEGFAEYIGKRDDIWYATNIEIYEYVHAYHQLICSADGKRMYNPTAEKLFFQYGEGIFCIMPQEVIEL